MPEVRIDYIVNFGGDLNEKVQELNQGLSKTGALLDDIGSRGINVPSGDEASRKQAQNKEEKETEKAEKHEESLAGKIITGFRKASTSFASSGGSGNLLPVGSSLLDDLSQLSGKLGPVGLTLMGAAGAVAGINAFSEQYEKVMPIGMKLAGMFGELGKSAKDNSEAFQAALHEASLTARSFGFSLEEGASVIENLSRKGMSKSSSLAGASGVFSYARDFGVGPQGLTEIVALAARYTKDQNVLGLEKGGLAASGLSKGQFQEFLDASLEIFEEGLSKGILRGFDEVITTQVFFSHAGKEWQGDQGAKRIGQISGAIENATNLSSETDVLVYRAARDLAKGLPEAFWKDKGFSSPGRFDGSYIESMMLMEQGASPQIFKGILDQIKGIAGGDLVGQSELVRKTFGVNYTGAMKLLELADKDISVDRIKAIQADSADSPELKLLRVQEEIRDSVRQIGAWAVNPKVLGLEAMKSVLDTIAWALGAKPTGRNFLSQAGFKNVDEAFSSDTNFVLNGISDPNQRSLYMSAMQEIGKMSALTQKVFRDQDGFDNPYQLDKKSTLDKYLSTLALKGDLTSDSASSLIAMLRSFDSAGGVGKLPNQKYPGGTYDLSGLDSILGGDPFDKSALSIFYPKLKGRFDKLSISQIQSLFQDRADGAKNFLEDLLPNDLRGDLRQGGPTARYEELFSHLSTIAGYLAKIYDQGSVPLSAGIVAPSSLGGR